MSLKHIIGHFMYYGLRQFSGYEAVYLITDLIRFFFTHHAHSPFRASCLYVMQHYNIHFVCFISFYNNRMQHFYLYIVFKNKKKSRTLIKLMINIRLNGTIVCSYYTIFLLYFTILIYNTLKILQQNHHMCFC